MSHRVPVAVRVLVVGLVLGVVALVVSSWAGGSPAPGRVAESRVAGSGPGPLAVLHEWDERRAAAWSGGDGDALGRLYTRRSTAGAADVALLHRYAARGLRVQDMRMQVLGVRVLARRPRMIVLEVLDRLDDAVVTRPGDSSAARRLPSDGVTTHHLVLRLVDGRWLMARVSVVGSGGARP
ncbi:MAG TPA: hypothetical protein VFE07_03380 [Marmoricola sp.]|nr:hypothetical protein [Marmoricola sp.]